MSLLKQIDDKGAVLEWCPIAGNANMVSLGTKVPLYIIIIVFLCLRLYIRTLLGLDSMIMVASWRSIA